MIAPRFPRTIRALMRRALFGVLLLVLAQADPSLALADGELDAAEHELESGEFERAIAILAELAEEDADLSRPDLERLLTLRAVAGSALGRDGEVDRVLLALASLLNGREPNGLPPNLDARFRRVRRQVTGPIRVRVTTDLDGSALVARIAVEADPGSLTDRTELVCRRNGVELGRTAADELSVPARGRVECRGEARGPGGASIASAMATRTATEEDEGSVFETEAWPWIVIGAGAAVLIGIIIGIAIAASASGPIGGPVWVPEEM